MNEKIDLPDSTIDELFKTFFLCFYPNKSEDIVFKFVDEYVPVYNYDDDADQVIIFQLTETNDSSKYVKAHFRYKGVRTDNFRNPYSSYELTLELIGNDLDIKDDSAWMSKPVRVDDYFTLAINYEIYSNNDKKALLKSAFTRLGLKQATLDEN